MRIIECDRCHKRFNKDAKKTGYVNLDQRDINTGELDGNHDFDGWDVCDDCMQKIREFVRNIPEKPKATIKKMPASEGRSITKADKGRLSQAQKRWIDALTALGYKCVVAHGWNEAKEALEQYINVTQ